MPFGTPDPHYDRSLLKRVQAASQIPVEQRKEMRRYITWCQRHRGGPPPTARERQRIADAFRAPIQTVGRAAVAGFVEYGIMLIRLQASCDPGTWTDLFREPGSGPRALLRPIPLSIKQAQALMRIARNPVLSDPGAFDALPPHWRTLDDLTRVPVARLNEGINKQRIHPHMQRADVAALRDRIPVGRSLVPAPAPAPLDDTTLDAITDAIRRAVDRYTGPVGDLVVSLRSLLAELEQDAAADVEQDDDTDVDVDVTPKPTPAPPAPDEED